MTRTGRLGSIEVELSCGDSSFFFRQNPPVLSLDLFSLLDATSRLHSAAMSCFGCFKSKSGEKEECANGHDAVSRLWFLSSTDN
jgi:hypothetical protein